MKYLKYTATLAAGVVIAVLMHAYLPKLIWTTYSDHKVFYWFAVGIVSIASTLALITSVCMMAYRPRLYAKYAKRHWFKAVNFLALLSFVLIMMFGTGILLAWIPEGSFFVDGLLLISTLFLIYPLRAIAWRSLEAEQLRGQLERCEEERASVLVQQVMTTQSTADSRHMPISEPAPPL